MPSSCDNISAQENVAQLEGKGSCPGELNHTGRVPQDCKGGYLVLVVEAASCRFCPFLPQYSVLHGHRTQLSTAQKQRGQDASRYEPVHKGVDKTV